MEITLGDILAFVLFVFVLIPVVLFLRAARAEIANVAQERNAAALRGWRFEIVSRFRRDARYEGTMHGVAWSFRTPRFESEDLPSYSQWTTEDVRLASRTLQVWPSYEAANLPDLSQLTTLPPPDESLNRFFKMFSLGPFEKIARSLSADFLIPDIRAAAERVAAAEPYTNGDEELARHYLFRSNDPELVKRFLDCGAARELTDAAEWLANPSAANRLMIIMLWDQGLTIAIRGATQDLDLISRIAKLGSALGDAAQRAAEKAAIISAINYKE